MAALENNLTNIGRFVFFLVGRNWCRAGANLCHMARDQQEAAAIFFLRLPSRVLVAAGFDVCYKTACGPKEVKADQMHRWREQICWTQLFDDRSN